MDIELANNGGGGSGGNNHDAVVVLFLPNAADPGAKERQPCTWLRAAPYVVAVLAGVALLAVGVAMASRSCSSAAGGGAGDENKPASSTIRGGCADLGYLLALVGGVLVFVAAYVASTLLTCQCCVPRLEQADD